MRDIPIFSTQLGVASLTLSQIPYTKTAYIRIQDTASPEEFLRECVGFCKAVDAQRILSTGNPICEAYSLYTHIYQMQAEINQIGDTDAALFPVTEKTLEEWREVYNKKSSRIPTGVWMTAQQARQHMEKDGAYFVHRAETLIGTGLIRDNTIEWVCAVQPGGGEDAVRALCHAITCDTVALRVASANKKALTLYERLGFVRTKCLDSWYKINF